MIAIYYIDLFLTWNTSWFNSEMVDEMISSQYIAVIKV